MTDQVLERFWEKVEVQPNGCWLWTGANNNGYGVFYDGKFIYAHRFTFQVNKGPIAEGMTLDHLCRTPSCVNPDHLEIVTSRENTMRGIGPTAINALKTHCNKGHPLSGDNLYLWHDERYCRTCNNIATKEYRQRRKQK